MIITIWKKVYKELLIIKYRDTHTGKEDWTYFLLRDCKTENECNKHTKEDILLFNEAKLQLDIS